MDKFNNTIITNAGRKLLNNVSGGQGKITYTKAVLYNQDISSLSDEDLMALTSLSGDVVTTNISIVKVTDTTVTAEASFTNAKLTQDVTFNAIGWFASVVPGDDETLIAVTPSATTQTLVAGSNGKATASVDFKLLMGISHDAQVHLTTNEAGTIDQTHLDNALRDLAAKGLINQGEDIGNDVDISQIHNTSIQTANGTDLTNMPKDYSNHGYLISIGSNDTTKDGIHVLYDTQKNIQYVQYFNNKTNKWTDWLANSTEQDLKDLKKNLDDLIATKADSSDVTTLQAMVTSQGTEIAQQTKLTDDVYTKAEVDGKLSTVGTVKTVDEIQPDSSGNVDLRPEFNSLLGRNNLLTDDEMDISKATKTDPAQNAISNAKYANGISTFHYCGVSGWETFYWKIVVQPNTNYEFTIIANSTNQLTALAATEPYIPIIVDSSGGAFGTGGNTSNGDLGNGQLNLPWQGIETGKVIFNSKNYSNIYIGFSLGSTNDGVNTDITLQTTLLKADPIQSQIDNLQNQTNTKANSSDVSALQNTVNNINSTRTPIVAGASDDDLFAFKTNQIRLYSGNGKACKNLPPAANTQWFTVQYVFETPNEDGIAIYRSPANEIWTTGCNGGIYDTVGWTRVANSTDVTNLQSMITGLSTKVDSLQQNSLKIVPITQADYNNLNTKDPNTIYAIGG